MPRNRVSHHIEAEYGGPVDPPRYNSVTVRAECPACWAELVADVQVRNGKGSASGVRCDECGGAFIIEVDGDPFP